jgi:biotin synthase-related radical SAM superfamily protein
VSKFTPGPWKLGRCGQILGEDGEFICKARKWTIYQYSKSPVEKANAALIAAAPELYNALDMLVEWVKMGDYDAEFLEQSLSALAKARGNNPTLSTKPNQ